MSDQINLPADAQEPAPPAIAKASIAAGGPLAALVPQTLEDAFRLSKALAASGDMVPKHFQRQPEMIMAAVLRGAEIGLAPMQALSNIAVINGRASIWGDALPALLQRAGHHIDVAMEGEGDTLKAVATLTRGDTGRTVTREFSVADAKKASLWGKAGPWQTYPQRMLQMRARAWAVRDGAADALMGLQVTEEMQDVPPPRDVTPKPGGFAAKAAAAKAQPADDIVSGQIVDGVAGPHWAEGYVPTYDGFPTDAFTAGVLSYQDGFPVTNVPHDQGTPEADEWIAGWLQAKEAA